MPRQHMLLKKNVEKHQNMLMHYILIKDLLLPKYFAVDSIHSKKRTSCSGLIKTALNNALLPTLFTVVICQQFCSTLLHLIAGSTTCSVLLTTLNNFGSKTMFNAVLIRPEQVVRFWLFTLCDCQHNIGHVTITSTSSNLIFLSPGNTDPLLRQFSQCQVDQL